jgi:hypothetical protein
MVLSSWRHSWSEDFARIVNSMTRRERKLLFRSGLSTIPGRRAFMSASNRMALDVTHSTYLMELAALDEDES